MRAPLHTHTSVVWGVESLCVLALELGREWFLDGALNCTNTGEKMQGKVRRGGSKTPGKILPRFFGVLVIPTSVPVHVRYLLKKGNHNILTSSQHR